jgi:hypothetical protein
MIVFAPLEGVNTMQLVRLVRQVLMAALLVLVAASWPGSATAQTHGGTYPACDALRGPTCQPASMAAIQSGPLGGAVSCIGRIYWDGDPATCKWTSDIICHFSECLRLLEYLVTPTKYTQPAQDNHLTSCFPGTWKIDTFTCACPLGLYWNTSAEACQKEPPKSTITLSGGGTTQAMPAGPALPHVATVVTGTAPAAGKAVTISTGSGGSFSGVTDGAGQVQFTYTPPSTGGITDTITASCSNCSNTASKTVRVEPCEVCEGKGNPILPATGEKVQAESDWSDPGVHGLSFTRHYRSYSSPQAGLGPR